MGVVQNNWPHSFKNSTESNGRLDSKESTVRGEKMGQLPSQYGPGC